MFTREVREVMRAEPFEPFVIRFHDGRIIPVFRQESVALGKKKMFVIEQGDDITVIEPKSIAALDPMLSARAHQAAFAALDDDGGAIEVFDCDRIGAWQLARCHQPRVWDGHTVTVAFSESDECIHIITESLSALSNFLKRAKPDLSDIDRTIDLAARFFVPNGPSGTYVLSKADESKEFQNWLPPSFDNGTLTFDGKYHRFSALERFTISSNYDVSSRLVEISHVGAVLTGSVTAVDEAGLLVELNGSPFIVVPANEIDIVPFVPSEAWLGRAIQFEIVGVNDAGLTLASRKRLIERA